MGFLKLVLFFVITTTASIAQASDPVAMFLSSSKAAPSYKGIQKYECSSTLTDNTNKPGKTFVGWVETSVEVSPSGEFFSHNKEEKGSKYITIYLKLFVAGKRPNPVLSDFTEHNYEITFNHIEVVDPQDHKKDLIWLNLKAKRKENYLMDGNIILNYKGDMLRAEGYQLNIYFALQMCILFGITVG